MHATRPPPIHVPVVSGLAHLNREEKIYAYRTGDATSAGTRSCARQAELPGFRALERHGIGQKISRDGDGLDAGESTVVEIPIAVVVVVIVVAVE